MAIALDADTAKVASGGGSPVTWTHTCTGSSLVLLVSVTYRGSGLSVSAVTYNGVGLTRIATDGPTSPAIQGDLWYLVNPATGANTVSVTFAGGTPTRVVAHSISFTGVDQATPIGTAAHANGSSTTPSATVSSAAGELVVDALCWNSNVATASVGAGQTQLDNDTTSAGSQETGEANSDEAGAASVTMSWTLSGSTGWSLIAVPLKPAAAAVSARPRGILQPPISAWRSDPKFA